MNRPDRHPDARTQRGLFITSVLFWAQSSRGYGLGGAALVLAEMRRGFFSITTARLRQSRRRPADELCPPRAPRSTVAQTGMITGRCFAGRPRSPRHSACPRSTSFRRRGAGRACGQPSGGCPPTAPHHRGRHGRWRGGSRITMTDFRYIAIRTSASVVPRRHHRHRSSACCRALPSCLLPPTRLPGAERFALGHHLRSDPARRSGQRSLLSSTFSTYAAQQWSRIAAVVAWGTSWVQPRHGGRWPSLALWT